MGLSILEAFLSVLLASHMLDLKTKDTAKNLNEAAADVMNHFLDKVSSFSSLCKISPIIFSCSRMTESSMVSIDQECAI